MDNYQKIKEIIAESNAGDPSSEEIQRAMDTMLGLGTWEEVRNCLLHILYDNDQTLWNETIRYIYYFQNRGYGYEAAKTIAALYHCLEQSEEADGNLIWTITIGIKSISYLSEYEPYHDKEVVEEMSRIRAMR